MSNDTMTTSIPATSVRMDVALAYQHVGGNRAMAMIGGSIVPFDIKGTDRITVKFQAKAKAKITAFTLILGADDLYAVEFWTGRGVRMRTLPALTLTGLYADQVIPALENVLGLYFRL